jgi:AbrB family looped-hinge helix DNA binding protein
MASASVTSKGQITIPKVIRDLLQIKTGDRVDFVVDGDHVVLRAGTLDFRALRGLLHKPGRKAVSLQAMDAAVAKAHARGRKGSKRK